MAQVNELERLEQFVSRLLAGYKALKEKNDRLTEELIQRDETIGRLQQDLSVVDRERLEISGKITKLVSRIEQWETELIVTESEQQTSDNNGSGVQGSLFAAESDNTNAGE